MALKVSENKFENKICHFSVFKYKLIKYDHIIIVINSIIVIVQHNNIMTYDLSFLRILYLLICCRIITVNSVVYESYL